MYSSLLLKVSFAVATASLLEQLTLRPAYTSSWLLRPLTRAVGSSARLHEQLALPPAYTASLQLLFCVVCSTGFYFWRSDAAALGRPRCPWSPSVWKYADIVWFAGASSSKRRMWPKDAIACPLQMCLFDSTDTVHTTSLCLSSVASESQ